MNEQKIEELVRLFEMTDRWKTRLSDDPLNGFHIKIHDYDTEMQIVTFSWWDGKDKWEDDLWFEQFYERFEPWY